MTKTGNNQVKLLLICKYHIGHKKHQIIIKVGTFNEKAKNII